MCNWKYFLFVKVWFIFFTTLVNFSQWILFLKFSREYLLPPRVEISTSFCLYLANLLCYFEIFIKQQKSDLKLLNLKIFVRALLALSRIFYPVFKCFSTPDSSRKHLNIVSFVQIKYIFLFELKVGLQPYFLTFYFILNLFIKRFNFYGN